MNRLWLSLMAVLLAACSPMVVENMPEEKSPTPTEAAQPTAFPTVIRADLEDLGPAPELDNEIWLNVDQRLRLADLRGNVVMLDMWTFG